MSKPKRLDYETRFHVQSLFNLGFSPTYLARRFETSRQTIYRWGKRPLGMLKDQGTLDDHLLTFSTNPPFANSKIF